MLQVQPAGLRAENLMQGILHAARICNASPNFHAETLRAVAQRVNPKRYELCNKKLRLHRCSSDQILDFVYGVDHVIDVGERVYAGIDLTLNAAGIANKVSKARQLTKMRAHIGIRQFIVVRWNGGCSSDKALLLHALQGGDNAADWIALLISELVLLGVTAWGGWLVILL